MNRIAWRRIMCRNATVGDKHDPTSQTTFIFAEKRNGHEREVKLVQDFGLRLYLNGRERRPPRFHRAYWALREKLQSTWAQAQFRRLTGITPAQFERAYERVHPWFDDPMGHPSMYE